MKALYKSVSLGTLFIFLSGCASLSLPSIPSLNGNVSVSLQKSNIPACPLKVTFTNESETLTYTPLIEMIAFDDYDNTLGTTTFYFDPILPGKQQKKTAPISFEHYCTEVHRIKLLKIYDRSRCNRNGCVTATMSDFIFD